MSYRGAFGLSAWLGKGHTVDEDRQLVLDCAVRFLYMVSSKAVFESRPLCGCCCGGHKPSRLRSENAGDAV